jgi:hypothetical protein
MLPVAKVSATVEMKVGGGLVRVEVEHEPEGLVMEPGIDDIYDAIEGRYGWERFVREVTAIAVARLASDVNVSDVEVVQVDEEAFEEAELGCRRRWRAPARRR